MPAYARRKRTGKKIRLTSALALLEHGEAPSGRLEPDKRSKKRRGPKELELHRTPGTTTGILTEAALKTASHTSVHGSTGSSLYCDSPAVNRALNAARNGKLTPTDPAVFHLFAGGGSDDPLLVAILQGLANDILTFQSRSAGECTEELDSDFLYRAGNRLLVAVAVARDLHNRVAELEERAEAKG